MDASSSMTYKWNADYNRFAIARNILLQIVDSIYAVNNEVEFGVRLYGTEHAAQEKNCTDSRLIVGFNLQNVNQIKQSLKYTEPIGWSPIAYSLQQAAFGEINDVAGYDYSIIFITDGGESCGGDICKTYKELLEKKVSVTPYIIGLDKNEVLKGYYDCLGKFVPVLAVDDIPKAVKLIVDENRPILNKKTNLNLNTVFSNSPVKKDSKQIKEVVKKDSKQIEDPAPKKVVAAPKKEVKPLPKRTYEVFPKMVRLTPIKRFTVVGKRSAGFVTPLFDKIELVVNFEEPKPIVPRQIDIFPSMISFPARYRFVYAFRAPTPVRTNLLYNKIEYSFTYTPIKRDTVIKEIVSKVVAKKAVVKNNPIKKDPNTVVSREVIPNEETMVQVFFANKFQKSKKYRNATPTILIQDAKTKEQVGKFIRTTTRGTPDWKRLKAGTYNFIVKGDERIMTPDVRIDANNINKVTIFVQDGSIEFAFKQNLKRPVKEYVAIVNRRFEEGSTVMQECKDKLFYPPGTYYIEIKSLPAQKFAMVELGFGEIRQIQIDEPGFVQINNENRLGRIDFTHELNDADARFHSAIVNGDVADQKIRMQPGNYKVVFPIDPNVPVLGTKTIQFKVNSNEVTQLQLE